jgi:hypothetical protein
MNDSTRTAIATTEELIDAYGDIEIEFPNGGETFGDAFGRVGAMTFETAEAARLTAHSVVGDGAIGRKHYSDRDPSVLGENGHEQVSF